MKDIEYIDPVILAQWHLYVKDTGHEMHDKIATFTGVTLGFESNYAVK